MKANVFLGRLKTMGKNVDWLIDEMAKRGEEISRSSIYKKLRGESEFTAPEIKVIVQAMDLSNDDMLDIFFNELVS